LNPDPSIRRVLIHRLGSLGDTVVALPCFHLIARVFPNAERRLLTNFPVHAKAPASAAVLEGSGLVHGYMRYTAGTRNPAELLRLAGEIRRFRPDVVVYLFHIRPWNNVRRDKLFFRLAGVRRVVGFASEQEMSFRFDAATGFFECEADRLARLIAELGDADTANLSNWDLLLSDAERYAARDALGTLADGPLIVCGPGTKMPAKDWGAENWQALLGRIAAKYPGHGLALVGAKEEFDGAENAAQLWTGPKVNLCGRLVPRQTAAVIERASIFLGPDSGPMHLAAAAGVPCAIAFSAAGSAGKWFPRGSKHQIVYHQTSCSGCNLEKCNVQGHPCLASISVVEMEAAVDRAMNGQDGSRELIVIR
jgi:ADP-heptose:LPS heptosyltransferase